MSTPLPEPRWWNPVCAEGDLGAEPLAVPVLGASVVLWRGADGIAAFDDRCPHRGAALSLGRVVDGRLQCAYHGWCFDGDARCVHVPAQPGFVPPAGHGATAWRVTTAHGLVWVARPAPAGAPPAVEGVPARRVICGPYDVATSAPRVVENFLDTAHFAFVHAGWLGESAHAEVPPYDVDHTADGRPLVADHRAWQPRASASASGGGQWVRYRYEVLAPHAALLVKRPEGDGPTDAYAVFALARDDEHTRAWFVQWTGDATTPDADLQRFQDTIFGQDRAVLESQRPRRLPLQGGEVHSAADRLSAAYRRWLRGTGSGYGCC